MKQQYSFEKAPRCSATSKRTKQRCGAPAERGKTVCRFHGARCGAPKGRANGAYKHGMFTNESIERRRELADLIRQCRETMDGIQ
jgi:hypothetical protein